MFNFDFYNPTHIIFGKDRLDSLDAHVPANATVLITFGGGSAKKCGLIDKIKTVLGNRKVYEFGGIERPDWLRSSPGLGNTFYRT